MLFTTSIVGEQPNGTPDGNDGVLYLPPTISPIVQLRSPIRAAIYQVANPANQLVSHMAWNRAVTPASSAAVQALLTRLNRGRWEVFWSFFSLTDWTRALTVNADDMGLYFSDPNGLSGDVITSRPLANVPFVQSGKLEFTIPSDGWAFFITSSATGVAQNSVAECSLFCNKLD